MPAILLHADCSCFYFVAFVVVVVTTQKRVNNRAMNELASWNFIICIRQHITIWMIKSRKIKWSAFLLLVAEIRNTYCSFYCSWQRSETHTAVFIARDRDQKHILQFSLLVAEIRNTYCSFHCSWQRSETHTAVFIARGRDEKHILQFLLLVAEIRNTYCSFYCSWQR
jgi:hypothetical protein